MYEVDRCIIDRSHAGLYRDQGYQIRHCPFPGKVLAVFLIDLRVN